MNERMIQSINKSHQTISSVEISINQPIALSERECVLVDEREIYNMNRKKDLYQQRQQHKSKINLSVLPIST